MKAGSFKYVSFISTLSVMLELKTRMLVFRKEFPRPNYDAETLKTNRNMTWHSKSILTTLTRDIPCEKFIEDVSVSRQIQCILMFTSQI